MLLKLMNYSYMHDILHPACNEEDPVLWGAHKRVLSWYLAGKARGSVVLQDTEKT